MAIDASNYIWFGNVNHADWLPKPSGITRTRNRYMESMQFDNGGRYIKRTKPSSLQYDMSFPVGDSSQQNSIELLERFAHGEFSGNAGTQTTSLLPFRTYDWLHFMDPMQSDQNLFNETWANPGLAGTGHKLITDPPATGQTVSSTVWGAALANTLGRPQASEHLYIPSTVAPTVPPTSDNSIMTFLVPPLWTLWLGVFGTAGTNSQYNYRVAALGGTIATSSTIALQAFTSGSSLPFNTHVDGGSAGVVVQVWVSTTNGTAVGDMIINSQIAQMWPTGTTPASPTRFIPGKGHMGLRFDGEARVETYALQRGHLSGASITLSEVEPWS